MSVFEPGDAELLDVVGVDLDDQDTRRGDGLGAAAKQGTGVAADADVAVGEQEGLPASLGEQ
ncbi:hypothetical protein NGB36_01165 [Streptomyces sp. RB6PN25]|uniref:Uncharacterized protein n=1 Tax=Streptomyces humicola TaxID=2953240 RepID=A0ABT1PQN6_9ACTN|nr:hypothetical protein [Streptomyces humicola]MCQ4079255.1 hypothetical protein [Streptomyces humicola]